MHVCDCGALAQGPQGSRDSQCMCASVDRRGYKAVVFVLEEFDLFARPGRQTLLYELLDALQTTGVQVRCKTPPRAHAWSATATGPGMVLDHGSQGCAQAAAPGLTVCAHLPQTLRKPYACARRRRLQA